MKKQNIFKMCCSALFAAVICASIVAVPIPLPGNGYFNLGDCFIIISSLCLGPIWGGLAGGIGASLSDLVLGYGLYAPATFIIKFLMAIVVYFVYKTILKINPRYFFLALTLGSLLAEMVMVLGYFVFEIPVLGFAVATANIIGNLIQGCCGFIASVLIYSLLYKLGAIQKIFKNIEK